MSFDFPVIRDFSRPSVSLHKNGKYLLIKPNDAIAADILREVFVRFESVHMRLTTMFGAEQRGYVGTDWKKIELWRHLKGDINRHPICEILRTYNVEIGTSDTLRNYITREYRRRVLEETPYPAAPVDNSDVSLFGRCNPGTPLLCRKSMFKKGAEVFAAGKRYLVTSVREQEGVEKVVISTEPIIADANINLTATGKSYEWSEFDPMMEEWFDDSETVEFGETMVDRYPEQIKVMEARLAKLSYVVKAAEEGKKHPLYKHVRVDACQEALKRGVINTKLMRMGKTSEMITICELWGSEKIGVVGTRNVRLAWRKEFRRLGMENWVFVNKLADLDKEGKYYLFTYDFLKDHWDPTEADRNNYRNYLKKATRNYRRKVQWSKQPHDITVFQHNPCPHCKEPLERPVMAGRGVVTTRVSWTTEKGYLCRNPECRWVSDNRCQPWPRRGKKKGVIGDGVSHRGAAWAETRNRLVRHRPGTFIDTALARHAQCSGTKIKGRICLECGTVDGVWHPPLYKRVKDRYSVVVGDEIHNAKEDYTKSQTSLAMYSFRPGRRIAATGTLLSNAPTDAYWPLHWAVGRQSEMFPWQGIAGKKTFESRFCNFAYFERATGETDEETGEQITKTVRKRTPFLVNPPDWWKTMQPLIVRRTYEDPLYLESLEDAGMIKPDHHVERVAVRMHPAQSRLMLAALKDFKDEYEKILAAAEAKGHEVNKALVIAKMAHLRTIATVPERMNKNLGVQVYDGPDGGGKTAFVVNLVRGMVARGQKVFIVSDFIEMQIAIEKALKDAGFGVIRMPSSWNDERRMAALEEFADNPAIDGFIAGTRSVREAIDVSCAGCVICPDMLWSPAWQMQAWSRPLAPTPVYRDVPIYLMTSENSLDEYIYTVFYAKMIGAEQALDRKVISRKAKDFDVKAFAQRVIEQEDKILEQLSAADVEMPIYNPGLDDDDAFEERAA